MQQENTEDSLVKLRCPLCFNLIFKCVTTLCGHSFCEVCLDNYLLVFQVSELPSNSL
jgi:Zinc finger, C3HC4 type (RING finger)